LKLFEVVVDVIALDALRLLAAVVALWLLSLNRIEWISPLFKATRLSIFLRIIISHFGHTIRPPKKLSVS